MIDKLPKTRLCGLAEEKESRGLPLKEKKKGFWGGLLGDKGKRKSEKGGLSFFKGEGSIRRRAGGDEIGGREQSLGFCFVRPYERKKEVCLEGFGWLFGK